MLERASGEIFKFEMGNRAIFEVNVAPTKSPTIIHTSENQCRWPRQKLVSRKPALPTASVKQKIREPPLLNPLLVEGERVYTSLPKISSSPRDTP